MQIRLGYELVFNSPQPTPMILQLQIHYSRVSDLVAPDHMVCSPTVPLLAYRDGFGNWCSRVVAPPGRIRFTADTTINDSGEPDAVDWNAWQHDIQSLPDDTLVFLLGSRYCETDRLYDIAWSHFGQSPRGWGRV